MSREMKFIKNVVDVEVDGLRGVNHYTIRAMYNKFHIAKNGMEYATVEHRIVDELDYAWDEIERDGGISQVNRDLKDCYNIEI